MLGGGLLVALLGSVAILAERASVTDEERLEGLFDRLVSALAREDRDLMDSLLVDPLSYSGPRPIGDGDRPRAFLKLDEFWKEAQDVRVVVRELDVQATGSVGVLRGSGNVRFRVEGSLVVYKVSFEVAALRTEAGWRAQGVRVTDLGPGIF